MYLEPNENFHFRGMHIVVLHPENGKVFWAKVFDTYISSEKLEHFITTIPDGYIIAAGCKDECTRNLSDTVKEWFGNMGST